MHILITGSAGFIGFHLSHRLLEIGHDLTLVDRFSDYYSQDLKRRRASSLENSFGKKTLDIDLSRCNYTDLLRQNQYSHIIHLAGQPGVRVTPANQQTYLADNVTAFSNILNLALELKVPNFIYASSSSIYQSAKISPFIESENLSAPTNFYARTKFIDEKLAESFSELISNVCGLRFFSAYGPWGRPDMAYFKLFQAAYSGSEFLLNGDGEISRDFTFIDDVTNSLLKLIDSSFVLPRVLNIGGGNVHTMNELVSNIQNITGRKIKVSRLAENQQDLRVTNADTSLQKSTLGDYPKIDLFHGLGVMDNWIKSLPDLDTFIKWR